MSEISRGAFNPSQIRETWSGKRGPIQVVFRHDNLEHTLHPQYLEDYIDVGIAHELNALIRPSGYQFEIYESFDQTAFLVVLTSHEKNSLERERRWRFIQQGVKTP